LEGWIAVCKNYAKAEMLEMLDAACDCGNCPENVEAEQAPVVPELPAEEAPVVPELVPEPAAQPEPEAAPAVIAEPAPAPEVIEKPKATRKKKAEPVIIDVTREEVKTEGLPVPGFDVVFDRTDKSQLASIVDDLVTINPEWKCNPDLVLSIKNTLNKATGKWIYSRNKVVNKALVAAIVETAISFGKTALPEPSFKA
jgi:outer membrane biosynthesis protein TonB